MMSTTQQGNPKLDYIDYYIITYKALSFMVKFERGKMTVSGRIRCREDFYS